MIYDVIYSLLVLIEELKFFNKKFQGFIMSLKYFCLLSFYTSHEFQPFLKGSSF